MNDEMVSPIGHNELFAEIFRAHDIKIDSMKIETAAGNAQIEGWLQGDRVIPIGAWMALHRLTADQRIPAMFRNARQLRRETMPAPRILPAFLTCLHELEVCAKELHEIVADGRITDADQPRINLFAKHKRCLVDISDLTEAALFFRPTEDE